MYVVRRSFRNLNQMMVPGSVVEPGSIKHFKSRLRDRVIIEVNEHDFDKWNKYFHDKFGVNIITPKAEAKRDAEVKSEAVAAPVKPATAKAAKPVAKASVKPN